MKLSYWTGCDPVAKMSLEFLKLGKYLGLQSYSMKFRDTKMPGDLRATGFDHDGH